MPVLLAAVALLGLAVGSFLNVVIHRVPIGASVVRPGSHCPACDAAIRTRHNIPVLGWIALRGRCADCAEPISMRYPLVEFATAALFVAVAWQSAQLDLLPALPALLLFTASGIALSAIDLDTLRLPNRIVYPTFVAEIVLLAGAAVVTGHFEPFLRAVIASTALAAVFFAIVLAKPGGMGLGDVKLAAVVGAVLGFVSYPAVVVGVFAAFVLGSVAGAVLLIAHRAGRKTAVPFGPALVAGAVLALFVGTPVANAYASLAHLA